MIEEQQATAGDVPFVVPSGVPQHDPGPPSNNHPSPRMPGNTTCNDIAWTAAYPLITNYLCQYYGDIRAVERRYLGLMRYIVNLVSVAGLPSQAGLAQCDEFSDWLCGNNVSGGFYDYAGCYSGQGNPVDVPSCPAPKEMGGCSYVLALRAMASMAHAHGKYADSARYSKIAAAAVDTFHREFYNTKTKTIIWERLRRSPVSDAPRTRNWLATAGACRHSDPDFSGQPGKPHELPPRRRRSDLQDSSV